MQLQLNLDVLCLSCDSVFTVPAGEPLTVLCPSCRRQGAPAFLLDRPEPTNQEEEGASPFSDLVTVPQLADETPFTVAQIRGLLFNRHSNGLDVAVVKVGNRLYLDRGRFRRWLDTRFEADEP